MKDTRPTSRQILESACDVVDNLATNGGVLTAQEIAECVEHLGLAMVFLRAVIVAAEEEIKGRSYQ